MVCVAWQFQCWLTCRSSVDSLCEPNLHEWFVFVLTFSQWYISSQMILLSSPPLQKEPCWIDAVLICVSFSHTNACFCSGDSSLSLDQHHLCLIQPNSVFTHRFMFFSSPFSFYKRKHQIWGKCQWTPATVLPAPLPFLSPMILLCFPLIPSTTQSRCSTYPMMYWCPAWWARHVNHQVITGLFILLRDQKYCWNAALQIWSFIMVFHHLPEFFQKSGRTNHILFLLCPFESFHDSMLSRHNRRE